MTFESSLRLLSPFMPFLTEELWHAYYDDRPPAKSIALMPFPRTEVPIRDEDAENGMWLVQSLITEIRALRKEIGVEEKATVPIEYMTDAVYWDVFESSKAIVQRLARVSEVRPVPAISPGLAKHHAPAFDVAVVYERTIDVAAERERLTKEIAKYEKGLAAAERQLGNDAFLMKAPPQVVEGLKKQAAETGVLLEKARKGLEGLPPE